MDKKTYVTENFCREEFCVTSTGFFNVPSKTEWDNLYYGIKKLLQPLRERIGVPIIITSGYRSKKVNKAVGGSPTSQHMTGNAVDFKTHDPKDLEKCVRILSQSPLVDQLLAGGGWIHLSWSTTYRPRRIIKPHFYG